jgi:predicted metalloprotease with PDZ domain
MRKNRLMVIAPFVLLLSGSLLYAQTSRDTPNPRETPAPREGNASPGFLGIMFSAAKDADHGITVHEVAPDSPALKAGLKSGDVIVKANDQEIKDTDSFLRLMEGKKPGDKLDLGVLRNGKEQQMTVTLGERPRGQEFSRDDTRPFPAPPFPLPPGQGRGAFLGVQTEELTPDLKKQLNVDTDTGAVVTDVVPNSPAAKAGLKKDDVIVGVNDRSVKSPADLREDIQKAGPGQEVTLQVFRGKDKMTVKATPQEGFGFFPGARENGLLGVDIESMWGQARKVRDLERRLDMLEKRLNELEKKSGSPGK